MLSGLSLEGTFKKVANQLKRVGGGARFFNAQGKRGESVELHQDLNSSDRERQKNALKRIIANMTLGRDVSQLFADVVKLGQTPNLEVKKLVYLYVLNNAKLQPEKALMAVNTFLQDATHQSPIVRALALRTMLCLRVDSVLEYTIPPLVAALTTVGEADAYVRKTAAIGIGKVYHQSPVLFEQHGLMQHLVNLLADTFPVVSSNAAAVLAEIVGTPNGPSFEMQKMHVSKLLNALADATEWGQVYILEALAMYRAPIEEVENLTERVLPRLNHTNAAVALAAIKAMAAFVQRMPGPARTPYIGRMNASLLTLAKSDPETQYVVARNANMLLTIFPDLLSENFESFFIRFSDPPYVKFEKLRLLLRLVGPASAANVVKELEEYSNEVDPVFIAEVTKAAAVVGVKVESTAERCAALITSIASKHAELLGVAVIAAKDMLRRYPNLVIDMLPRLVELGADAVPDEEARCAFVWMLGEFSDVIERGSELMDELVASFSVLELPVQRALLTSVIKLFLRNPAANEKIVMRVLDAAMRCSSNPDLRDRALFYYRLLSRNIGVERMSAIVLGKKVPADVDKMHVEGMSTGEMTRSLNTVAAVYAKPPRKFLLPYGIKAAASAAEDDDEEAEEQSPTETQPQPASGSAAAAPAPAATAAAAPAPAAKPAHADPFDIFADPKPAASTAAAAPAAAPKPDDPFDAMFGGSSAKPAASSSSSGNMPPEVVPPGANQGIALCAAFAPANGETGVVVRLGVRNTTGAAVTDVQLQLNRNRFGLAPASAVSLPSPIAGGSSWTTEVPLSYVESHAVSGSGFSVQCGVSVNGRVSAFNVDLPPALVLAPPPSIQKNDFARQWQALDAGSERKLKVAGAGNIEAELPTQRIAVVAKVGADRLFCAARLHNGALAMLEIITTSGDVTLRSAKAAEAFDIVSRALPGSAAAKSSSVDDLFA